jgi:hypothetical protein
VLNGVGNGRIGDGLAPNLDRQLTGHDGCAQCRADPLSGRVPLPEHVEVDEAIVGRACQSRNRLPPAPHTQQKTGRSAFSFDNAAASMLFTPSVRGLISVVIVHRRLRTVRSVVERVSVHDDAMTASHKRMEIATVLLGKIYQRPSDIHADTIELTIEAKLRRAGKRVRLVVGGGLAEKPDGQLIALLRDAHATRDALMTGRDATIDSMAQRLGIKRDNLSARMRLTYLAPDVVRALVVGRQPEGPTPAGLLSLCKDLPHDWQLQRTVCGLETR